MLLRKKEVMAFDRSKFTPVIRRSICTGESTAGFKDLKTGKFLEIMRISGKKDFHEFLKTYGIKEAEVTDEW
ncbi:MAG TPA: aspartate dehydrogenase [Candidatus Monoglobus merdigallinarum]|uniref:Aspartate dehydrogenase n=1 Tax=Candidatus Monoglobus merdigallinarum TaxID=2838698 RepID=A0A9D1PR21_9FIRM|nr:aspartate dehydrogenase [Candidatus Monoglobus merdigallinarum]